MSVSNNPYTPPLAHLAGAPGEHSGPPKLVSARGRIGRLRLFVYMNTAYLLFYFIAIIGSLLMGGVGALAAVAGGDGAGESAALGALGGMLLVMIPVFVIYFVFILLKMIQRAHDMGWSGWSVLLTFIPLVGLIWFFKRGTDGANEYGLRPPPNTTLLKVGGWIYGGFAILSVIGIIAAVAIPFLSGTMPTSG